MLCKRFGEYLIHLYGEAWLLAFSLDHWPKGESFWRLVKVEMKFIITHMSLHAFLIFAELYYKGVDACRKLSRS